MQKKIFVTGNPLITLDSIQLKVARELNKKIKEIKFLEISSLEEIKKIPKNLIILDSAIEIKKIIVLHDLNKLVKQKPLSSHDFDLATELLLYKKLKKLQKVTLILIPCNYNVKKAVNEINAILLSKNGLNN